MCICSIACEEQLCALRGTWLVVDVGHRATFGGDVAQVDLLGLDLDLWAAAQRICILIHVHRIKGSADG